MINKHYLITLLELYYYRQSRVWEEIERNDLASMDDRSFSLYLKTLIKDKRKKDTFDILEINKAIEKAKKIVDYCKHNKVPIKIISFESANYPTNKFNTIPKSDNPVILYVVGNSKLLKLDSVAFIGSRNTDSIYYDLGIQYAKKLAKKYIIVSGLARGSDTAGHEGALLSGKTVAVLANGLDKVYPKENKDLANKIYVNGGALISEYPPYSMTKPYFFAQRDRLQAALSKAIVVLETGIKSGTMITIDYAKKYGRAIYVVPPIGKAGLNDAGNYHLLNDESIHKFDITKDFDEPKTLNLSSSVKNHKTSSSKDNTVLPTLFDFEEPTTQLIETEPSNLTRKTRKK